MGAFNVFAGTGFSQCLGDAECVLSLRRSEFLCCCDLRTADHALLLALFAVCIYCMHACCAFLTHSMSATG
eukprot:4557721-Amphidinium_carterae.2